MLGALSVAGAMTAGVTAAVSIDKCGATASPCSRLAKAIGAGVELVSANVTAAPAISGVTSSETQTRAANGPEATVGLAETEGLLSHVIVCSSQLLEATLTVTPFLSPSIA